MLINSLHIIRRYISISQPWIRNPGHRHPGRVISGMRLSKCDAV